MKTKLFLLAAIAVFLFGFKSDKPAYRIFNEKGKKVKFAKMIDKIKDADVVFFGELHDNPISHWLELEVAKALFEFKSTNLILGAEMFESDNQLIIDEYLLDVISASKFEDEARIWPNYKTDYKPFVQFAHDNKLRFIATNVPRRYASLVYKKGFEGLEDLTPEAKLYIPDLPIKYDSELECYKAMLSMGGGPAMHGNENLPKAQALKDATMAHFILKNLKEGTQFLHYNGAYHSDNFQSIVWYLKQARPELNIKTITTQLQAEIDTISADDSSVADFIILVPESMTRTY